LGGKGGKRGGKEKGQQQRIGKRGKRERKPPVTAKGN